MKKLADKFLTLTNSKATLSISGLVIAYNDELTLLRNLAGDYLIDGFIVVINKHVNEYQIFEEERFREKVIKLKLKNGLDIPTPQVSISSFNDMLHSVSEQYGIFQINVKDPKACYLGSLKAIDGKSITIKFLTPLGKWGKKMTFKKSEIRSIEFGTDYVESLKLLAKPIKG